MHATAQNNILPPFFLFSLAVLIGALIASSVGCDTEVTEAEVQSQVEKIENEKVKLAAMKERQAYETDMEAKVDALHGQVEALKDKADQATGKLQIELRAEIAKLETKCEQMQDTLAELKAASGDLWAKTKIKSEETWDEVSDAVETKVSQWKAKLDDSLTKAKEAISDDQ